MLSKCLQTEALISYSEWGINSLPMSHIVRPGTMIWAFLCQKQLGGGGRELGGRLGGLYMVSMSS